MVDGVEEQSRFAGWRREVWLFMKAQLSAQIATVIDFLITILLVKLFGIYYLYATFIGSVVGGIVNCVINYEWVFKAEDCKKIHVGLKYFLQRVFVYRNHNLKRFLKQRLEKKIE